MIDKPVEKFMAKEAIAAGLVDAVKSGATKIAGMYELTPDGFLEFKQKTFSFIDKGGNLRFGKFESSFDVIEFWRNY